MRKVRLVLEDLSVESFDTTPGAARPGRGTVHGRGPVAGELYSQSPEPCESNPCSPRCVTPAASCDGASCLETCGSSCDGTCEIC